MLPVKYKIANGYSDSDVYMKSTLLYISDEGSFATTKVLVSPLDNTDTITPSFLRRLIISLYTLLFEPVIITSMSPDDCAPRR